MEAAARTGLAAAERVDARTPRGRPCLTFHGVLPALITPFTEDGGAIDTDALARASSSA